MRENLEKRPFLPVPSRPSLEPHGAIRPSAPTVTLFPDLALLREEEAAAGRLWLGRERVTAALTEPDSPTYLCSPRHLRRLLKRGNGRFWTIQEDKSGAWQRVCLRSRSKVADRLGMEHVAVRPVAVPRDILLGRLATCGLISTPAFTVVGEEESGPISRVTLEGMSGASPRAQ